MPSRSFAEEPAWVTRRAGPESGTASQIEKAADACALELRRSFARDQWPSVVQIFQIWRRDRGRCLDVLMWGGCNVRIAKIYIYTELGV